MLLANGACFASIQTGYEVADHALFVGEDGEGLWPLDSVAARAANRPAAGEMPKAQLEREVARLIDRMDRSPLDTVTLFIHGGLVSHRGGYEKAVRLGPALERDGHYPLFIIWEAGWGPTLADHLKSVRRGQEWKAGWGWATSPFIVLADLGQGYGRAPMGMLQQAGDYCARMNALLFADSLEKEIGDHECGFLTDGDEDARRRSISRALATESDPLKLGLGTYRGSFWNAVGRTTLGVATVGPKFVLTGPLIDGFGGGTWNNMLRRTETMFRRREEMALSTGGGQGYRPRSGAVSVLLDSLGTYFARCPQPCRKKFILAGHSMGAIVATKILRQQPQLPYERIYFLAAAASVAEVEASVIPILEDPAHQRTLFYNGMLHPRVESGEWQPKFADLVPRGSLLEWIDDALGAANTPIERTAGKWVNMAAMNYIFPTTVRPRVVLKGFGFRDPRETGFRYQGLSSHGAFSDPGFQFWRDSTWRLHVPHHER